MNKRQFVILDRDGTIIAKRHYLSNPSQVELLPGTAAGLRHMAAMGLGLVVITNQSGISRGYFDHTGLQLIHMRMAELLGLEGVRLDGVYVCPHHPDEGCACRKPGTELGLRAAAELGFSPPKSFVIGDSTCDMNLGRNLGAATVLVRTGDGAEVEARGLVHADYHADDLAHAAEIIDQALAHTQLPAVAPAA